MPSLLHEALLELFRQRPGFAAELMTEQLHLPVPAFDEARLDSIDFNDIVPTEYRADAVVILTVTPRAGSPSTPVFAFVVESQLDDKPRKRRTWPVYATTLAARLDCPVAMIVICDDASTAAWCAKPFTIIEPDCLFRPLVIGPEEIPKVTDPDHAARRPELTVLSTRVHGDNEDRQALFDALLIALGAIPNSHRRIYYGLAAGGLQPAHRIELDNLWSGEDVVLTEEDLVLGDKLRWLLETGRERGRAEGEAKGEARGEARGEAKAVLAVLGARGIDVPSDIRSRITNSTDVAEIETWLRRAANATDVLDLFRD